MSLTKEQEEQIAMQLKRHDRATLNSKIDLMHGISLELIIEKGVFCSDIMSSGIYLARFLYEHIALYKGKKCLDMGCGPGIQGLIMAKYGAKHVDFTDISQKAVKNTRKNIEIHKLKSVCKVYEGDLFDSLSKSKKYDVIIFNHPFFSEEAENFGKDAFDDTILRKSMLGGTELIKRFFSEVKKYMKNKNSLIIMPYFHFAGKENDPSTHVRKYGFYIEKQERVKSEQGLQLGDFSIYTIKMK